MIDRKYKILAVNPCTRSIHTENDSVLFSARDRALPVAIKAYIDECERLDCGSEHIESLEMLLGRVILYQRREGRKIPDTDTPCEIDRCIGGKGL